MGLMDVPGKLIDSAATLTEKKLEVTAELLKTYYQEGRTPKTFNELMDSFEHVFDGLKKFTVTEPPLTFYRQHKTAVLTVVSSIVTFFIITLFLIHKYGFHDLFDKMKSLY